MVTCDDDRRVDTTLSTLELTAAAVSMLTRDDDRRVGATTSDIDDRSNSADVPRLLDDDD